MKIIIFDDDPTGSQTVRNCPLLLSWDYETLLDAYKHQSNLIFILANTRSLSSQMAEIRLRDICKSLKNFFSSQGLRKEKFIFVSRGDSTLRGHGILEPNLINQELGSFDATFHIPAFFEGGRITKNGVHFVNGCPVHETDFAKDHIFGYKSSNLAKWLEEKSSNKIKSDSVININLEQLNAALNNDHGFANLVNQISDFNSNQLVTVDAEKPFHLEVFVKAINNVSSSKRFLFRSAASLINALSGITSGMESSIDLCQLIGKDSNFKFKPGIILIGSHVALATDQLSFLLQNDQCSGLKIDVEKFYLITRNIRNRKLLMAYRSDLISSIIHILESNKTPVLFTSRKEKLFEDVNQRLDFGLRLAEFMAELVGEISHRLGYIISKGGVTSNLLLGQGLNLKKVTLQGQILPGLSLVTNSSSTDEDKLPVITFPGNLGNQTTLYESWRIMESAFN